MWILFRSTYSESDSILSHPNPTVTNSNTIMMSSVQCILPRPIVAAVIAIGVELLRLKHTWDPPPQTPIVNRKYFNLENQIFAQPRAYSWTGTKYQPTVHRKKRITYLYVAGEILSAASSAQWLTIWTVFGSDCVTWGGFVDGGKWHIFRETISRGAWKEREQIFSLNSNREWRCTRTRGGLFEICWFALICVATYKSI